MAQATVKTHVAHTYRKLGLRDVPQAVVYAQEAGLVGTPADSQQGVTFELGVEVTARSSG